MNLNTITHTDCLLGLKALPDACVDLTVTSPPYDNLRDYNGYSFDFELIAKEVYRVTKEGGVLVWVVADGTFKGGETGTSFKQALYFKEIGFTLHDTMIYMKNGFNFPAKTRYHQVFEYMFILSKGKPKTFNPIKDRPNKHSGKTIKGRDRQKDGSLKRVGERKPLEPFGMRFNVWEINNLYSVATDKEAFKHPAVFPEQLAHDHIISWSNEGDTVLDPFAGSGTTLKVARDLNRQYIGFEISDEYVELIKRRLGEL